MTDCDFEPKTGIKVNSLTSSDDLPPYIKATLQSFSEAK